MLRNVEKLGREKSTNGSFPVYEQQESWRGINGRTILRLWTLWLNYSVRKINESGLGERVSEFLEIVAISFIKRGDEIVTRFGEKGKEKLNLGYGYTSEQSTVLLRERSWHRLVAAAAARDQWRVRFAARAISNAMSYDDDVSHLITVRIEGKKKKGRLRFSFLFIVYVIGSYRFQNESMSPDRSFEKERERKIFS